MPVSSGGAGGIVGMTLRAWALVSSTGTLIRGEGVVSVSRSAEGSYLVTLGQAIDKQKTLLLGRPLTVSQGAGIVASAHPTPTIVSVSSFANSTVAVDAPFHIEVWV